MKKTKFKKNAQKISYKPDTCLNSGESSKWFSEFPWLHYNEQSDSVLCDLICMQQNSKSNLQSARSIGTLLYFLRVFRLENGVGVIQGASSVSESHKIAIDYETNLSRT